MENKSGDGKTSPFGDGKGATGAMGSDAGKADLVKDPTGKNPGGSHNFVKDPTCPTPAGKPEDHAVSLPQKMGSPTVNPDSVPAGGKYPFGTAAPNSVSQKPFKVSTPPANQPPANPDKPGAPAK